MAAGVFFAVLGALTTLGLVRQLGHVPALGSRIEAVQTRSEQTAEAQRALEEAFRNATPEQTATPVPTAEAPATPPSESDGALLGPRIAAQPEPTAGPRRRGSERRARADLGGRRGRNSGRGSPRARRIRPGHLRLYDMRRRARLLQRELRHCAAPGEKMQPAGVRHAVHADEPPLRDEHVQRGPGVL